MSDAVTVNINAYVEALTLQRNKVMDENAMLGAALDESRAQTDAALKQVADLQSKFKAKRARKRV